MGKRTNEDTPQPAVGSAGGGSEADLRPPLQARSRRTLERIVNTVEGLLDDRTFDEVSVSEIVERSATSKGAFYTRFGDKRSLLLHLDDRFIERSLDKWAAELHRERWRDSSVAAIVEHVIGLLVRANREHGGLLRTMVCYARCQSDDDFRRRGAATNQRVSELFTTLLVDHRDEIGHPEPETAGPLGLLMAVATIRELVLFDDLGLYPVELTDEALTSELTAALLAYLEAGGEPS